jgi:hypothetical protein
MSPAEIVGRTRDALVRRSWRRQRRGRKFEPIRAPLPGSKFLGTFPSIDPATLPQQARDDLLHTADELLQGRWHVFGYPHSGLGKNPDWFVDANSGRRHGPIV